MKNGISLLMIAKNEESVIKNSLQSFSPFVDEMIVADTGSLDQTGKIANECGAKTVMIPWKDNFSEAKNSLIEFASYKWVLFVDADENLKESSASSLQDLTGLTDTAACLVRFEDYTDDGNFCTYDLPRLFLNTPGIRYKNCVHETITASLENILATEGLGVQKTEITFRHTGYLSTELKRKKTLTRNLALLKKANKETPDDVFILLKYGDNLRLMKKDDEALDVLFRALDLIKTGNETGGLYAEVCSSLTTLLIKRGDLGKAQDIINGCPQRKRDVSLLYNLGITLWKKGEIDAALQQYTLAEKLLLDGEQDPHGLNPFILNGIGELNLKQKRIDRSEIYFKKSHASAPGLLQPLFNLMRLSLEKSDIETARHYLHECERIAPDNTTIAAAKKVITANAE